MSFAGILDFKKALDIVMESKQFKEAGIGQQLEIGYRLINGGYKILCEESKVNPIKQ